MSGFFTPGLPAATPTTLTDAATIPVDTNLGSGVTPQSVAATPQQIGAFAQGAAEAITYGAAITLDASANSFFSMTFGAGNASLTISNAAPGQIIYGLLTQDGVGSRLLTVANGSGGTTIVSGTPLSTNAGYVDLIAIMNVGTAEEPLFAVWPVAKHFV